MSNGVAKAVVPLPVTLAGEANATRKEAFTLKNIMFGADDYLTRRPGLVWVADFAVPAPGSGYFQVVKGGRYDYRNSQWIFGASGGILYRWTEAGVAVEITTGFHTNNQMALESFSSWYYCQDETKGVRLNTSLVVDASYGWGWTSINKRVGLIFTAGAISNSTYKYQAAQTDGVTPEYYPVGDTFVTLTGAGVLPGPSGNVILLKEDGNLWEFMGYSGDYSILPLTRTGLGTFLPRAVVSVPGKGVVVPTTRDLFVCRGGGTEPEKLLKKFDFPSNGLLSDIKAGSEERAHAVYYAEWGSIILSYLNSSDVWRILVINPFAETVWELVCAAMNGGSILVKNRDLYFCLGSGVAGINPGLWKLGSLSNADPGADMNIEILSGWIEWPGRETEEAVLGGLEFNGTGWDSYYLEYEVGSSGAKYYPTTAPATPSVEIAGKVNHMTRPQLRNQKIRYDLKSKVTTSAPTRSVKLRGTTMELLKEGSAGNG